MFIYIYIYLFIYFFLFIYLFMNLFALLIYVFVLFGGGLIGVCRFPASAGIVGLRTTGPRNRFYGAHCRALGLKLALRNLKGPCT